MQGKGGLDRC
jgi:hypothetical protein